jgi:hypothetical protein
MIVCVCVCVCDVLGLGPGEWEMLRQMLDCFRVQSFEIFALTW